MKLLFLNIICIIFIILIIYILNTDIKCCYLKSILYFLLIVNIIFISISFSSFIYYTFYNNKIGNNDNNSNNKSNINPIILDDIQLQKNKFTDVSMKDLLYNNIINLEKSINEINEIILKDKQNNIIKASNYEQRDKLIRDLNEIKKLYENTYISKNIFDKLKKKLGFAKNIEDSKLYSNFSSSDLTYLYNNF
jgi:hypothetical protein